MAGKRKRGRPREYGAKRAVSKSITLPPDLLEQFTDAWERRGSGNLSRGVQAALRSWLSANGLAPVEAAAPVSPQSGPVGVYVSLSPQVRRELERVARGNGSVPAIVREAIGIYLAQRAPKRTSRVV